MLLVACAIGLVTGGGVVLFNNVIHSIRHLAFQVSFMLVTAAVAVPLCRVFRPLQICLMVVSGAGDACRGDPLGPLGKAAALAG